jgi:hypothetical protein
MPQITIDFSDQERDALTFDTVLDRIALIVMTEWDVPASVALDGDSENPTKIVLAINSKIEKVIRQEAADAAEGIAQRILDKGVIQVDEYGYRRGKEIPVAEIIANQVKEELSTHGGNRRGAGALQELIRTEVSRELKGELKETLDEAKRTVMDAVGSTAIAELRKALADGVQF